MSEIEIVLVAGFPGVHLRDASGARVWLTPEAFAFCDVARAVTLDAEAAPLIPDGLNEVVYSEIVHALRQEGYAVHTIGFDFRKPVLDAAAEIASALAAMDPDKRFVFVAHSMGALVTAVYPYVDPAWRRRIERVIFLGGTLSGTFEVIDVALAAHRAVNRLCELSLRNSPADYAACLRTWPSLYDMLPDPGLFARGDEAFDAASWPLAERPPEALLAMARHTRKLVDESPLFSIPTTQILSTRFSTADAYADGQFAVRRPRTAAGDGTVPVWTALRRGGPVHRVALPHTLIPIDPAAIRGVIELCRTGSTTLPLVTEEEAREPVAGYEPTLEEMIKDYAEMLILHPERIARLAWLYAMVGPPGV